MNTSDFDYILPEELIAQEPLSERAASRMMVVRRTHEGIEHSQIKKLPDYLRKGDLLVVNDTKVIPARIFGRRADTGGTVELLLLERMSNSAAAKGPFKESWSALVKSGSKPRQGMTFEMADGAILAKVSRPLEAGEIEVELMTSQPLGVVLEKRGVTPLPPYIRRNGNDPRKKKEDRSRYQTVYARNEGAVAAPTAGLHFDRELLRQMGEMGVDIAAVTLHVGPGTFRPVKTERLEDHVMHEERYSIGANAAGLINAAVAQGRRVVAVGTTVVRTLESAADEQGAVKEGTGRTSLFIRPPWDFKVVDALLTNFHLPRSTLLMLVSAFAERELVLKAYAEAVQQKYRFFSYGDCMLIV